MIKKLNHAAYRCKDSEQTRAFYEDFLGLPLVCSLPINTTKTGRTTSVLHTFFQMEDGSAIAFFEEPEAPFDFKVQRDFDLHIALEVEPDILELMKEKGRQSGMEVRGISDHGFIHSIYFRDPNGYVVELACKVPGTEQQLDPTQNNARAILNDWQAGKKAD